MQKTRYIILICFSLVSIFMASLFFTYNLDSKKQAFDTENLYQTWQIKKFYKNGKLVLNDPKYDNLRLKINRDGTAQWIREGESLYISFEVTPDGSQIIIDDGYTIENIETIFELSKEKFRFGKRNAITHYEYVMVPLDFH
ncbi:hypothetical protein RCC89_18755 [Cytophagaceae bacterium ABcell3]|nr:hypothetical protein RCC89_18755 [Cytophagaceae bacterium ABcell3]